MTADRHARVKQLFLAAIELPACEHDAWLDKACGDDILLRQELEALLAQHTSASAGNSRSAVSPKEHWTSLEGNVERLPGTIVANRYRIVSPLGVGGMGIVYRADDLTLDQEIAIKFLPPSVATNPAWLARFRNEVRLARSVSHPHVCRIHDIGETDQEYFITMEFVPGEDLSILLRRIGRLPVEKAIAIGRQICSGLAAAHRAGVLHRDLKPANIMLDDQGNVRITDFGIAGVLGQIAPGDIRAGTPAYMAPEQITGRDVTVQSDIYALGLVLYELFSGDPAFQAATFDEYLRLHESAIPRPLTELVENLPEGVEGVVNRCLQKQSELRPPSALHVAAALPGTDVLSLALQSGMTPSPDLIAASPVGNGQTNHRWKLALAGTLLLTLLLILRSVYPLQWDDLGTTPPAALAERARQILETAGFNIPNPHQAFAYSTTEDAFASLVRAFGGDEIAAKIAPANPNEPCYLYRESHRPIVSATMENLFWRGGYVTPHDPPMEDSESRAVLFDKAGRLILLGVKTTAEKGESKFGEAKPRDEVWSGLHRSAGLDFHQTASPAKYELSADGVHSCAHFSLASSNAPPGSATVSMGCSSNGAPIFFAVGLLTIAQPQNAATEWSALTRQRIAVTTAQRALFLLLLSIGVPFGIFKFRTAKVDFHGALRLVIVVTVMEMLAGLLRLGNSGTLYDGLSRLCLTVVRAVGIAGLLGVFYLAIDAHARRVWPHLLVTWNRLLLCRFNDPDVRFHTLIGVCVGCWWAFMAAVERAGVSAWGANMRPMPGGERLSEKLHGIGSVLSSYLGCLEQALIFGVLFLLLLVVIRTWIRNPAWAAVVCVLLLMPVVVPRGAHAYTAWLVMGLGGAAVAVWIMMRYGLLAIVDAILVATILNTTPLNVRLNVWTSGIALFAIVIVACLIAYGIMLPRSTRVRPPSVAG